MDKPWLKGMLQYTKINFKYGRKSLCLHSSALRNILSKRSSFIVGINLHKICGQTGVNGGKKKRGNADFHVKVITSSCVLDINSFLDFFLSLLGNWLACSSWFFLFLNFLLLLLLSTVALWARPRSSSNTKDIKTWDGNKKKLYRTHLYMESNSTASISLEVPSSEANQMKLLMNVHLLYLNDNIKLLRVDIG